jgi:hypothetical protein
MDGSPGSPGHAGKYLPRLGFIALLLQVYLFTVAPLSSKAVQSYEASLSPDKCPPINPASKTLPPPKMLRLIALYENLTGFVGPFCSAVTTSHRPHPETPVSQSNNIVDISGVGLRQFWNLKNHMQDASTLATARYPETLDRIFVSLIALSYTC